MLRIPTFITKRLRSVGVAVKRPPTTPETRRAVSHRAGDEPLLLSQPLLWYSRKLETHPLMTKGLTSGLIASCGDLLAQRMEGRKEWDATRTRRFWLLGFGLVAPTVHVWYRLLMTRIPGNSAVTVAKRVFFDQLLFAPLFNCAFLSSLWTLEGLPGADILAMLKKEVPAMLVANWALWVPAQVVNFRFVPSKYQVLFSNVVALVWNGYLSYTSQKAKT
mmetsp:Transcript_47508/g.70722  ORF Transcript_47508/g.70722 Transcript_47508/m.70722 type:complete len:219 (-) Transcript_47508:149-805(-)